MRALIIAMALTGCADLAALEADGTCGNRVVETGEDCDSRVEAPRTMCAAEGEPHACHYVCRTGDDAVGCPVGMGCGRDGRCRAPGGTLAPVRTFAPRAQDRWASVDLDDDGRSELLQLTRSTVRVHGPDSAAPLATFPLEGAREAQLGDFDGNRRTDAILTRSGGVAQLVFTAELELLPRAAASVELDEARCAWVRAVRGRDGVELLDVSLSEPARRVELRAPLRLRRQVTSAFTLSELSPDRCPELSELGDLAGSGTEDVLAVSGGRSVQIFRVRCDEAEGCRHEHLSTVAVPGLVSRLLLADVDGDGRDDLVVTSTETPPAVALGDGGGHFCGARPVGTSSCAAGGPERDRARVDPMFDGMSRSPCGAADPSWLVAGDLDGDGVADWADRTTLYAARVDDRGARSLEVRACLGHIAGLAEVADVDGDGLDDLLAEAGGDPALTLVYGDREGPWSPVRLPLPFVPSSVVAADLDGDGWRDLAFTAQLSTDLWTAYGTGPRAHATPVRAGTRSEGGLHLAVPVVNEAGEPMTRGQRLGADQRPDLITRTSAGLTIWPGAAGRSAPPLRRIDRDPATGAPLFVVQAVAGRFGGPDTTTDFLLWTRPTREDAGPLSMWLVQVEQDGTLRPPAPVLDSCAAALDPTCGRWTVVDLDRDRLDEVVDLGCGEVSRPVRYQVAASGRVTCEVLPAPRLAGTYVGVVVADLDDDGSGHANDLLLVPAAGTTATTIEIIAFDPGRQPRSLHLDIVAAPVRGLAALDLDGRPPVDLAVLTGGRVGFLLRDADGTHAGRTSLSAPDDRASEPGYGPQLGVLDLDADGLDDLWVRGGELTVYRQLGRGEVAP